CSLRPAAKFGRRCSPPPRGPRGELSFPLQHPPRHRVELLQELRVARLGRGDQRGVEGAVGADRTRLVLAREIARQPRHQPLRLVGLRPPPPHTIPPPPPPPLPTPPP